MGRPSSTENPVEEFLSEKKGSWWQNQTGQTAGKWVKGMLGQQAPEAAKKFMSGAMNAGGAVLGATAVVGVGTAASKLYDVATKSRDFRRMLDHDPTLQPKHDADPRLFNQMYSTLRTFNPDFARDPVVASTYMHQMMDAPEAAGGRVVDALNFRDKMQSPFSTVTSTALGAFKGK
jgi:hypothetical protein